MADFIAVYRMNSNFSERSRKARKRSAKISNLVKLISSITLVGVWILFMNIPVYGEGNIKLGPLHVHPGISLQGRYDDNIFLTNTNKSPDFISTITPFLGLQLPFMRNNSADFTYRADVVSYAKHSTENTANQEFTGSLKSRFPGGLNLKVGASHLDTSDPSNSAEQSNIAPRFPRIQDQLDGTVGYRLSRKINLDLSQRFVRHDYETLSTENRDEQLTSLAMSYKFWPKTAMFVEASHGEIDYSTRLSLQDDRSSNSNIINVGLKWDPARRLTGTLKAGIENREFAAEGKKSLSNYVFGGDLTYRLTSKVATKLTLEKGFRETNVDPQRPEPIIEYVLALFSLEHRVNRKISLLVSGLYENDFYPSNLSPVRKDNYYGMDLALQYRIQKWWEVGASYTVRQRTSNQSSSNEYLDNIISGYSRWIF